MFFFELYKSSKDNREKNILIEKGYLKGDIIDTLVAILLKESGIESGINYINDKNYDVILKANLLLPDEIEKCKNLHNNWLQFTPEQKEKLKSIGEFEKNLRNNSCAFYQGDLYVIWDITIN